VGLNLRTESPAIPSLTKALKRFGSHNPDKAAGKLQRYAATAFSAPKPHMHTLQLPYRINDFLRGYDVITQSAVPGEYYLKRQVPVNTNS